jgi:DNA repair protein RadC
MNVCHNNLNELARLSIHDLSNKFKGIGSARAVTITAALELGRRRNTRAVVERTRIKSSQDLYELFEPVLIDLVHEEFWVAFLDGGNKVIDTKKITQGGIQHTVVDIPLILKFALEKLAPAIAVAHNHPSGQNHPSKEDDRITQRIKEGCSAIGIRFLDHVIIARGKYYSFCDEGKI